MIIIILEDLSVYTAVYVMSYHLVRQHSSWGKRVRQESALNKVRRPLGLSIHPNRLAQLLRAHHTLEKFIL